MTTKTQAVHYLYEGKKMTANQLIDLANAMSFYDRQDENLPEMETIEEAIAYLEMDGETVKKMETGGKVESVSSFLSQLDVNKMNPKAREYFEQEIMPQQDWDLVPIDNENFLDLKETLEKLGIVGAPKQVQEEKNETILKLEKEIEDLNILIEIEDDQTIIKRLNQEILDLQELISLEK